VGVEKLYTALASKLSFLRFLSPPLNIPEPEPSSRLAAYYSRGFGFKLSHSLASPSPFHWQTKIERA